MNRWMLALVAVVGSVMLASCSGGDDTRPVREFDLTAEVVDWTVVDGEVVEIWGYNGEYPGPLLEAEVGDLVRVRLTNNLPEDTTIHWHGLRVPNEQDGVPGITQPPIRPGETYQYEFVVDDPGTTMYHTHVNTVHQLGRGLVGPFVVRQPAARQSPSYDRDYTLVLHEIDGLFTINGHSFPATLEDEDSLIQIESGERIKVRMINAGQQHHPMHMHGHQFKVVALDGFDLETPYWLNTVDIAPGQTVDVEIIGDNPGTWTFHCHILPHVTNRGQYPGGMLTLVDYVDHTSFLEGAPAPEQPEELVTAFGTASPTTTVAADEPTVEPVDREIEMRATEFAFGPDEIALTPGEQVRLTLHNDGAVLHDITIPGLDVFLEAAPGVTAEIVFTVPADVAESDFFCSIAGHREAGMEGSILTT